MSVVPIRVLSGELQYAMAALQASAAAQDSDDEYDYAPSSGRGSARASEDAAGAADTDPCVLAVNGAAQHMAEHSIMALFQRTFDSLDQEDREHSTHNTHTSAHTHTPLLLLLCTLQRIWRGRNRWCTWRRS